jgi:hypothetical protein
MGYLNNEIDTLSLFFHGHFSWFFVKMSRTMSQKVVHWYLKRQLTILKKNINKLQLFYLRKKAVVFIEDTTASNDRVFKVKIYTKLLF